MPARIGETREEENPTATVSNKPWGSAVILSFSVYLLPVRPVPKGVSFQTCVLACSICDEQTSMKKDLSHTHTHTHKKRENIYESFKKKKKYVNFREIVCWCIGAVFIEV